MAGIITKKTYSFEDQLRCSFYETLELFICAFDEGYIRQQDMDELGSISRHCLMLLNGYIFYLKK